MRTESTSHPLIAFFFAALLVTGAVFGSFATRTDSPPETTGGASTAIGSHSVAPVAG